MLRCFQHHLGQDWWKVFSPEFRHLARARTPEQITQLLSAAGAPGIRDIAGQKIEAIAGGKILGRNKMALINQQIHNFLKEKTGD